MVITEAILCMLYKSLFCLIKSVDTVRKKLVHNNYIQGSVKFERSFFQFQPNE